MSAVATPARATRVTDPLATERSAPRLFQPRTGGVSLEDTILRAWEDLVDQGSAGCPVCGGRLRVMGGCEACDAALD